MTADLARIAAGWLEIAILHLERLALWLWERADDDDE